MTEQLSDGAIELAAIGRKQGFPRTAKRLGVSEAACRHWACGRRTPGRAVQTKLAKAYSIAPKAWTAYTAAPAELPAPKEAADVAHVERPLVDRYRSLARDLEETLAKAKADRNTPSRDVAQLGQALCRAYTSLAQLTGEGELTLSAIVRSRAWRTLLERISPVLEEHPTVAAALAEALEEDE